MHVRLLGPVGVQIDGTHIDLGPPQQRCVFAVLAMTPRQAVPVDVLVDRVWGDGLPRNVRTVLYTYVSRLRGLLADNGDGRAMLRRRDGGYALEVDPLHVDLHRARQLASRARAAAEQHDGQAAELLAEACGLWTGSPLTGVSGEWAERVRVGLDHERLTLLTERFEAALRVGQDEVVIGPLSQAVAANPLAESLAGLLMLALHRTGRQADALALYSRMRRRLVEEVGDEPGPALQRLHEQILRRDDTLALSIPTPRPVAEITAPPARAAATTAGQPWVPLCQLPPGAWHFVGREALVAQLAQTLTPEESTEAPVALITGSGGVGKTALATRVAQLVRDHYPDGQWYVRLGGVAEARDPAQIAAELLEASGVDPTAIPIGLERRAAALRARIADRKVLLLLDEATDAAQVRPLLPGTGGAGVLVTSRKSLGGLAPSTAVRLTPLDSEEAADLLAKLSGQERVAAEPAAVEAVIAACGGLPLAIRIAAARLAVHPEWTIERLAGRLRDRRGVLDELTVDDLAVRPTLELSYQALDERLQRALRWLGLLGSHDFTAWTAGVLADDDGDRLVEDLVTASLLDNVGVDATGEPRYRLHELVAAYAAELAEQHPAAERAAPMRRRLASLLHLSDAAYQRLHLDVTALPPTPIAPASGLSGTTVAKLTADPVAWLVAERSHLVAAIEQACEQGFHQEAGLLAERVLPHLTTHLGVSATEQLHRTVSDAAARAGDELFAWRAECHRCILATLRGELLPTAAALHRCTQAFERLGARPELAFSLAIEAACHQLSGDLATARELAEEADRVATDCGDLKVAATTNARLARIIAEAGNYEQALPLFERSLRLADESGRSRVTFLALLAGAALEHGDLERAERACREALALAKGVFAPRGRAMLLTQAAAIKIRRGRPAEALALARDASTRFAELGDLRGEANAQLTAGEAHLAAGDAAAAKAALTTAARSYHGLGLDKRRAQAWHLLKQADAPPEQPRDAAA